jgi:hypothetical protein
VGSRLFETGVDRGVLFTTDGIGVPWNGLTSVKESSPGADVSAYYLDGVKYLQTIDREDFQGTIEAFTYPDEFAYHDGTAALPSGLLIPQQRRKPFALSYRTRVGNDIDGIDHGYKLHIIYNALAQPSDKDYGSAGSNIDPSKFTWNFTTVPKRPNSIGSFAPIAHLIIDSTKTASWLLRYVEDRLYGSETLAPQLLSIDEIFALFEIPQVVLSIFANPSRGLSDLVLEKDGTGDLIGSPDDGLYQAPTESRLTPTAVPGYYRLES